MSKFVKYFKIRWFCVEVNIEALTGKIFNFNENNENHKVYPSACEKKNNFKKPVKSVASLIYLNLNVNSSYLKYSVKHRLHPKMICEYE